MAQDESNDRRIETTPPAGPIDPDAVHRRYRALPKEIGVLLVVAGIGGILLPGPVGTPMLILGGVVLWPKAFEKMDTFLENHLPRMHREGVRQIDRFIDDLNRRYPLHK
jgi:hypothetical protein